MATQPTKVRSYRDEVVKRLASIGTDTRFRFRCIGRSGPSPIFSVTFGNDKSGCSRRVLLSAGIHGEEPAGVYALLRFMENYIRCFDDDFEFLIFPCINPFGFEHNSRHNAQGIDTNREFKDDTGCIESSLVIRELKRLNRHFVCTIDLHETDPNFVGEEFTRGDNPTEFYMWEVCPDKEARIGHLVTRIMERFVPVCKWDTVYKDRNSGGVIWYPEGCANPIYTQGTTLEGYLAANYTPQSFTLETPCGWPMYQRIFAHQTALTRILQLKQNA